MGARDKSSLLDVRTYRGANVDSDHYLSIARLTAKKKTEIGKTQKGKRFNMDRLKERNTRIRYMEQLDEELRVQRIDSDANLIWKAVLR